VRPRRRDYVTFAMQSIPGVMPIALDDLGWNAALAIAFEPHAQAGLAPARVSLEHTHIYRVWSARGEHLARVAGRFRHQAHGRAEFPAVGDWVAVEERDGEGRIRAVLPRASRFSRRAAGDPTEEQVVAANVDTVFLVSGLDRDFNPRRIERYLLIASESGASPVIVLNKADLVDDVHPFLREMDAIAQRVPVVALSAKRPESVHVLHAYLGRGRTAALLGSSGVGKSSLANALIGEERLRIRDVRAGDSRGRHTSTARQMVLLPAGGILIDTPGMRELQLWDTGQALSSAFADIDALASGCRFRDCAHQGEPGCAVARAVAEGSLPAARFESFQKLRTEQAFQSRQQDQRAQLEEKRRSKVATKALNKKERDRR
jgi:ribosome biogenesis GTPase / thiamine phosphate phosphatase